MLLQISVLFMVAHAAPPQNHRPQSYRPVILMHGIVSGPASMADLEGFIKDAHPGTEVLNVDAYNDLTSGTELWVQVDGVHNKIREFIERASDGVNMACYSQGGLVCRGILEKYSLPKVKTFISLSSPQAGQFGVTDYLKYFFPNCTRNNVYKVAYTKLGQKISVANFWNDPRHQDRYKKYNEFLPNLNEDASSSFRSNFLNLEQLVLIGGPDDEIIGPWQSSHFAFYDEKENIVPLKSQDFYRDDTFGLRTLNEQGKLKVYEIPGVKHQQWVKSRDVFDKYIEPWLE